MYPIEKHHISWNETVWVGQVLDKMIKRWVAHDETENQTVTVLNDESNWKYACNAVETES